MWVKAVDEEETRRWTQQLARTGSSMVETAGGGVTLSDVKACLDMQTAHAKVTLDLPVVEIVKRNLNYNHHGS